MLPTLDYYSAIDRWSHLSPGGELSTEQAVMNDGARRMYAARVRASARTRLTPWWPDSDATLTAARVAVRRPRRLALPAPTSSDPLH
jgi:hypothetical protein